MIHTYNYYYYVLSYDESLAYAIEKKEALSSTRVPYREERKGKESAL